MTLRASLRQIGFYVGRLRKEKVTRFLIMSTASLALVLQLATGVFQVMPDKAYAATPNEADNIIYQGVKNTSDLLAIYDRNVDNAGHKDIQQIYSQLGVTRADLARTTMGSYKTNDFNGKINTLSRVNWANSGRSAVKITATGSTIYTGPFLNGANSQPFVQAALVGQRASDGQWFAITLSCGNMVYVVPPKPPVVPPAPKPAAACVSLTIEKISRTDLNLIAKATTANGATVKAFHYVVSKDGKVLTDRVIPTTGLGSQINQGYETGTYTAKVSVQTSLGELTSAGCTKTFTIAPPPVVNIQVCDLTTKKVVTIDEKDFDSSKYSKDLNDCKPTPPPAKITVCDLTTLATVTINESDFDSNKYSKNLNDCQQIVVCDLATFAQVTIKATDFDSSKYSKDIANCHPPVVPPVLCTVPGHETLPADSPDCVVTPPVLPHTGMGSMAGSVLGLGSVVASLGYYISSRRGLLSALLNR
jgi:hypothetical protein